MNERELFFHKALLILGEYNFLDEDQDEEETDYHVYIKAFNELAKREGFDPNLCISDHAKVRCSGASPTMFTDFFYYWQDKLERRDSHASAG